MNTSLATTCSSYRTLILIFASLILQGCSSSEANRFADKNGMVTVHVNMWSHSTEKVEMKDVKTEFRRADLLSTITGLSVEQYSAMGSSNDLNVSLNSNEGNQINAMYVMTEPIPLIRDGKVDVVGYTWKVTDTEKEQRLQLVTYIDRGQYSDNELLKIAETSENFRYILSAWIEKY